MATHDIRPYAQHLRRQLEAHTNDLRAQKANHAISNTREFVNLVNQIAAIGERKGVSMGTWLEEMKTIPYDEHHNFSYFVMVPSFFDDLLKLVTEMKSKLQEDRSQILDPRVLDIRKKYTADGFQDQVERDNEHYFQAGRASSHSHSLAHGRGRVSGRYATLMRLNTGGRATDGGYHFAV